MKEARDKRRGERHEDENSPFALTPHPHSLSRLREFVSCGSDKVT